jgi:hypothetical protein
MRGRTGALLLLLLAAQQLLLLLLGCAAAAAAAAAPGALPACDNAIPPGEGFGGTVTITSDCLWRQQLHFITALSGEQRDFPGALEAPVIWLDPDSTTASGTHSGARLAGVGARVSWAGGC